MSSAVIPSMRLMRFSTAKFHLCSKSYSQTRPKKQDWCRFFLEETTKKTVKIASVDTSPALGVCWRCFISIYVGIDFPPPKFLTVFSFISLLL